ncbi:MAG: prepilin-type N-terminal cleavage/methylation domain-containing protein [Acidobacteriia bacterium]|nr:prepilin-type N-terminal cleavage/methylation domain-containing protein [Terriglobia bacterium]
MRLATPHRAGPARLRASYGADLRKARGGFTLLEVLVATTIMAIAVGTLLSALSTSLRNASQLTESDRAAVLAQRTMDELLTSPLLTPGQVVQREWDRQQSNLEGGWRARVEPFDKVGNRILERVVLEIWWMNGNQRRTFHLEGYRQAAAPEVPR